MHDVGNAGLTRNDPAIQSGGLARIPFEELAATDDLGLALPKRLAVFTSDRKRDLVLSLAHECCGLADQVGAHFRGGTTPHRETRGSCCERIVQISGLSNRELTNDLFGSRINHGKRLRCRAPLTIDIELELGVGRHQIL